MGIGLGLVLGRLNGGNNYSLIRLDVRPETLIFSSRIYLTAVTIYDQVGVSPNTILQSRPNPKLEISWAHPSKQAQCQRNTTRTSSSNKRSSSKCLSKFYIADPFPPAQYPTLAPP